MPWKNLGRIWFVDHSINMPTIFGWFWHFFPPNEAMQCGQIAEKHCFFLLNTAFFAKKHFSAKLILLIYSLMSFDLHFAMIEEECRLHSFLHFGCGAAKMSVFVFLCYNEQNKVCGYYKLEPRYWWWSVYSWKAYHMFKSPVKIKQLRWF